MMFFIITIILVLLCFLAALISILLELKRNRKAWAENDDLSVSKWNTVAPGPDSLYPINVNKDIDD